MDRNVEGKGVRMRALKAAFPYTLPIFTGFWCLGIAYGVYATTSGFLWLYPVGMAVTIFGGSLEFIAVSLLLAPFAPLQVLLVSLLVQARHLFYGISLLDRYRGLGWKRFGLIYGLCDETFSIIYTTEVPEGVDRGWFMMFITWLDRIYWITGTLIGSVLGPLIPWDTTGLDFCLIAMFVVIFMEQARKEKTAWSSVIGFAASLVCLVVFGKDSFMVPTMIAVLLVFTAFRRPLAMRVGVKDADATGDDCGDPAGDAIGTACEDDGSDGEVRE